MVGSTCVALVFSALSAMTNPPSPAALTVASDAICQATAGSVVHPAWMVAYLTIENKDYSSVNRVGKPIDYGLFQINKKYNGFRFNKPEDMLDYYKSAKVAVKVIEENIHTFGVTWKGIASYNSHTNVIKENAIAKAYYRRWQNAASRVRDVWVQKRGFQAVVAR